MAAPGLADLVTQHLSTLADRWAAGLSHSGYDAVWLAAGNSHNYFRDDHGPAFKANAYFSQWVDPQFAQPGAQLLVRPGRKAKLFLPQPEDYWHAVAQPPAYLATDLDIQTFASDSDLLQACITELNSQEKFACIGAAAPDNEQLGDLNPPQLLDYMDFSRAIKTPLELALMRTASEIGVRGHLAAAERFLAGGSEFDIHMAYLAASQQNQQELPYGNIVALNEHGAVLHYQHQTRSHARAPQSLLIDAGGQHWGYASDITRTHVMPGSEHAEFAALIDAMQAHQDAIIEQIAIGSSFADLHVFMHTHLAQLLVAQQLVTCSANEAFDTGVTEAFCPHGLGHLLGLQVHDAGGHLADAEGTSAPPPANYPTLRFTRTLAADQVFTIEPGLYFIDSLLAEQRARRAPINWSRVERLRSYGGIRIEDNVRVLEHGVENLTRDAWARVVSA